MDNIAIIYKILKALEESMDYEDFDPRRISPDHLGISKTRLTFVLKAMKDKGFIEGITFEEDMKGQLFPTITRIRITYDGMKELREDSTFRQIEKELKGIKDAVPFL